MALPEAGWVSRTLNWLHVKSGWLKTKCSPATIGRDLSELFADNRRVSSIALPGLRLAPGLVFAVAFPATGFQVPECFT